MVVALFRFDDAGVDGNAIGVVLLAVYKIAVTGVVCSSKEISL